METFAQSTYQSIYKNAAEVRALLDEFERPKILEVFFTRSDMRVPDVIPGEYSVLYALDLECIRSYLLNQHPQDPILHKFVSAQN